MSWLITPQQRFTPAALLDRFPGPAAAYSLRNLVGTFNPHVVRVRRSSDNTEQDFTAAQVTDGTLTAFCGAGNGFVRNWYDQSGNNKHAGQETTANQPQVVSSGSLVTENSKAALSFNGTSHILNVTSATTSQPLSEFLVYTATQNNSPVIGSASSTPALVGRRNSGEYIMFAGSALAGGVHGGDQQIAAAFFDGASSQGYWNNNLILSGNPGPGFSLDLIGGNTTVRHAGTIQEIIVYQSSQSVNRAAIEANINGYYSVY